MAEENEEAPEKRSDAGESLQREHEKHPLGQMVVIGVLASAVGIALSLAVNWFPTQASTEAEKIDTLFDVLLIASVPVFVLVEIVVLFSVWKFRMRPGEEFKDGPPIHGNTRLEVVWTAIPAILLVGLCSYAYAVLHDIEKKQPDSLTVNVTGEQFAWTFQYPGQPATGGKPVASTQLWLPCTPEKQGSKACKGQPVQFYVRSKDVIHDFWIPQMRMKIDAVPGIRTEFRVTPNRIGTYQVVCAELCGLGHATMRQTVHVVPPAKFRTAMTKLSTPAAAPAGGGGGGAAGGGGGAAGGAAAGKMVFTQTAQPPCASCHTLADAGSSGQTGPNLDTVLKGKDAAFIRTSITNPNAEIAKGFSAGIMPPNYGSTLSKQDLDALVAYLEEVAAK
jgi:cytochrome c oxidase subunit 2